MKIVVKNGNDLRPVNGVFHTTTLVELLPETSLSRIPASVLFLIDASSSMGGNKWEIVKQALVELVETLKDPDEVGLVLFHSSAKIIFPLATLGGCREELKAVIQNLESPSGVTNLKKGLSVAFDVFKAPSKAKRLQHIILLTDGFPTDENGYRIEDPKPYEDIVRRLEHVSLSGIGIGSADDYDSQFISRLSEIGRGSYYHADDLSKFQAGIRAEVEKLQSAIIKDLTLDLSHIQAKIMRIAKVTPEILIYDLPGNKNQFEIHAGSMTKDVTSFLIQTSSDGTGKTQDSVPLFTVKATYDGKSTESIEVTIQTTDKEALLTQADPDVLRVMGLLQVHLNGQLIEQGIQRGDKARVTRLIENTTKISKSLGQDKVTRALQQLSKDLSTGKSVNDGLATIKDEARKTRLLLP